MNQPISIIAHSSISPLGFQVENIWSSYNSPQHLISKKSDGESTAFVSKLTEDAKKKIDQLRHENSKYKTLDNSVLYAIFASRQAIKQANWNADDNFGINIGSSRGATKLFEDFHSDFIKKQKAQVLSSPTTTLGNISSWVAHDLQTRGPEISHSITCSTALHALLNGIAWINSGMSNKFLVGGSEAPLTDFTIAQMRALKIYCQADQDQDAYPCQALNLKKNQNSMLLGEGAAVVCLERGIVENAIAKISGFGYATELLEHNASLSTNATCFQESMTMALGDSSPEDIDIIVTHTPGTIKGDLAEFRAIEKIFCNKTPALTTNKWKVGHSLGASGMLSLEMAILMIKHQQFLEIPFLEQSKPGKISKIMINAVGFGGNAVSIILSDNN